MSPLDRFRTGRREAGAPEPGMVLAEDLPKVRRGAAGTIPATSVPTTDPALVSRRDRLSERLTLMQLELGGLFYEMAIRDHVQMDVLLRHAGELQRVDAELAHVNDLLVSGRASAGGMCAKCQAPHARGAAFCWQCGSSLDPEPDTGSTQELDAPQG